MILQEIFWFVYPCILFYLWRCLQEYENYPTLETFSPNCATLVEFCQQKSVVYPNSWFMMFHFFQQPSVNWPWRCKYFIIHFWGCHNFSFVLKKAFHVRFQKRKILCKKTFWRLDTWSPNYKTTPIQYPFFIAIVRTVSSSTMGWCYFWRIILIFMQMYLDFFPIFLQYVFIYHTGFKKELVENAMVIRIWHSKKYIPLDVLHGQDPN